jgi:hypothetical protein
MFWAAGVADEKQVFWQSTLPVGQSLRQVIKSLHPIPATETIHSPSGEHSDWSGAQVGQGQKPQLLKQPSEPHCLPTQSG